MPQAINKLDSSVKDLMEYFAWFDTEFSQIIKNTCEEYWKLTPTVRLFSLEKNSKNFFSGNTYFVTGAQTQTVKYFLRLSDSACESFLTQTLGKNENVSFSFSKMTELEANIISKFNNLLFNNFKNNLLSPKEINSLIEREENLDAYLNLGFIIYDEFSGNEFELGKFFLSIPAKLIKLPPPPEKQEGIDITKFKKAQALVDIFVGKTKLSIDDIKHIEVEDIVLLEQSNIKQMKIVNPTVFDFNVNPDPRLFIEEDNDTAEMQMEEISMTANNIWDNVQVDVCAKFPQVKMSLGELREMSEGVVVELDSIYGNEIVLEVENKNVAKGELVIIGYKYGVKITEIFSQGEPVVQQEDEIEMSNSVNNDDFDVNDFEIEE